MSDPKSILDSIASSIAPAGITPVKAVVKTSKTRCLHGVDTTYDIIDLFQTMPSQLYNKLLCEAPAGACLIEHYADHIEEWLKDKMPCRGGCFRYVIRGEAHFEHGGYYCDTCIRFRQI